MLLIMWYTPNLWIPSSYIYLHGVVNHQVSWTQRVNLCWVSTEILHCFSHCSKVNNSRYTTTWEHIMWRDTHTHTTYTCAHTHTTHTCAHTHTHTHACTKGIQMQEDISLIAYVKSCRITRDGLKAISTASFCLFSQSRMFSASFCFTLKLSQFLTADSNSIRMENGKRATNTRSSTVISKPWIKAKYISKPQSMYKPQHIYGSFQRKQIKAMHSTNYKFGINEAIHITCSMKLHIQQTHIVLDYGIEDNLTPSTLIGY